MVVNTNVRRSDESLQQQSECITTMRALVNVLENEKQGLYAHTVRRGANRMVRLETTILVQQRCLERYRTAALALGALGATI